jgi:uncharacterized protein (DUF924 family)
MPFMHAEDGAAQERSVRLAEGYGDPTRCDGRDTTTTSWPARRFPHRNAVLGRDSTAEEEAFLSESDFRG